MKIAIVSDDGQTISRHFGRAENYIVISLEQEKIIERKSLPKQVTCQSSNRDHGRHEHKSDPRGNGFGDRSRRRHEQMFESIRDCDVLVSRGMGRGAYQNLQESGIKPIVTDIANVEVAIQAMLDDTIVDHVENLH